MIDHLQQDLRFAVRALRRTTAFFATAVIILGLGIGMWVAMFTVFRTMLVRRLPVIDQDHIIVMWTYRQPDADFGIRLALGATPFMLRVIVLRDAAAVASMGVATGLGGALVLARSVRGLLYDVGPADPTTLGIVGLLLVVAALAAAHGPARRAARTDPVIALRAE